MFSWPVLLGIFFGVLVLLMLSGMPVAFSFLVINLVGAVLLWGGSIGLEQLISSAFDSISKFSFLPLPMFILMGEILFHSGIATYMIDSVDKWLGKVPGRLSLIAVGSGTVIATLTGASMASVAMLGSVLVPQMEARGYSKTMAIGPILGSGGLAILIPPSGIAVILGAIGDISIGKILIAIILPGLMLACLYAFYIIVRCWLQPGLAPAYEVSAVPWSEKLSSFGKYLLPVTIVIFLVIGVMMIGLATPTEAAVTGVIGCLILTALYKKVTWALIKKSSISTLKISVMITTIVVGASGFAQLLAFSGATLGLSQLALQIRVAPLIIMWIMQIIVLFLGCFMEIVSILMVVLPIFMPIIHALGLDPVWFAVILMINCEIAGISPPFGLSLFVMQGVAPKGTTMGDIYLAGIPFCLISIIAMLIITVCPPVALWLISLAPA